jgi:hypothetical protein
MFAILAIEEVTSDGPIDGGGLAFGKHVDKLWGLAYTQQEEKNRIGPDRTGRVA